MKTTMLNYEEARQLLLQGYEVKLPDWKGYWKLNETRNGVEVHTKEGEILDTPNVMYTFHNNWEIATVENCPVLKAEKADKPKRGFKLVDMETLNIPFKGVTPMMFVKFDNEDKSRGLEIDEFEKLVGSRKEAMKMARDFAMSNVPKGMEKFAKKEMSKLDRLIDIASEMEDGLNEMRNAIKNTVKDEMDEECDCIACRLKRGEISKKEAEDFTDEEIEELSDIMSELASDITGDKIKVKITR